MTIAVDLGLSIAKAKRRSFELPPAHGGTLVDRTVRDERGLELRRHAETLPRVVLDPRALSDLELIGTGGLSPLEGFLRSDDYFSVIRDMRLKNGLVFSIPVTLTVPRRDLGLRVGQEVALTEEDGTIHGVLEIEDIYDVDRDLEALEVYRTTEPAHPGVAYLRAHADVRALGGPVRVLWVPRPRFPQHHRTPAELRAEIARRGWRRTVAFQTRNPIHRAHEYLLRSALETVDGLVVHPLVGETKGDDVPAAVRVRCYEILLERYFPKERAFMSVFPFAMRYAGPREAILHAIARQNYGFTHFIVGRDHAGVGNYYGTYDAQKIFDEIGADDLAIQTLFFEHSFHCNQCRGVASLKTCPHTAEDRLALSGTRVRQILAAGERLPEEFTRPEVGEILREAYGGST